METAALNQQISGNQQLTEKIYSLHQKIRVIGGREKGKKKKTGWKRPSTV